MRYISSYSSSSSRLNDKHRTWMQWAWREGEKVSVSFYLTAGNRCLSNSKLERSPGHATREMYFQIRLPRPHWLLTCQSRHFVTKAIWGDFVLSSRLLEGGQKNSISFECCVQREERGKMRQAARMLFPYSDSQLSSNDVITISMDCSKGMGQHAISIEAAPTSYKWIKLRVNCFGMLLLQSYNSLHHRLTRSIQAQC